MIWNIAIFIVGLFHLIYLEKLTCCSMIYPGIIY